LGRFAKYLLLEEPSSDFTRLKRRHGKLGSKDFISPRRFFVGKFKSLKKQASNLYCHSYPSAGLLPAKFPSLSMTAL
jgi:hypothetical protein